jgi:hypothetical protein
MSKQKTPKTRRQWIDECIAELYDCEGHTVFTAAWIRALLNEMFAEIEDEETKDVQEDRKLARNGWCKGGSRRREPDPEVD